ncbi:hypothetical protein ACIP0B_26295, partial [Pseudomonas sp. NPDC089534]
CPNPVATPTKPQDVVTWQLRDAAGAVIYEDSKTLNALSAGKNVDFALSAAFVQQHFEARRGETLTASYSIKRAETGKVSYSNPLTFVIGVALQLQPPRIQQAEADGQTLQPVKAKDALTAVVPAEGLQPADLLSVTWQGAPGSHASGSHTTEAKPISQSGYSIALPPTVLAFNLGKTVSVTYTIKRGDKVFVSPPLNLKVGTLPATALNSPVITDADAGNVLDLAVLGSKDVTIRAQDWALIAVGQQVWMSLHGRKADGAAHDRVVWNGSGSYVNATWFQQKYWNRSVPNSYFKDLADGSQLTLKFKAALDKSNVAANAVVFAERVYTVRTVPLEAPSITSVKDQSGWEIPDNGYTVHTRLTVSGTAAPGQELEVFDGTTSKGKVKVAADGKWSIELTGVSLNVLHSIKAVAQYGNKPTSNIRRFTSINGQRPAITAAQDSKGAAIGNGGSTVDTTVQLSGTANTFLEIELFDGTVSKGKATANDKGVWTLRMTGLSVGAHSFKAKALYGSGTESGVWALTVVAVMVPTLTNVLDANNVEVPERGLTVSTTLTLKGTASKGLQVEIFDGTVSKGQTTADASTGVWTLAASGLSVALHSFVAKALYGDGMQSSVWTLTVRAVPLAENFDSVNSNFIYARGRIVLPTMTISFLEGDGYLGIAPLSRIENNNHAPIHGQSSGQILVMHLDGTGIQQHMEIQFITSYSSVSFWYRFSELADTEVSFFNTNNQHLGTRYLAPIFPPQPFTFSSTQNQIFRMTVKTKRPDTISFDYFSFTRTAL